MKFNLVSLGLGMAFVFAHGSDAQADAKAEKCKWAEMKKEFCLTFKPGQQEFRGNSLKELSTMVADRPDLPWVELLDADGTAARELNIQIGRIPLEDQIAYQEAIKSYKANKDPKALLNAYTMLGSNQPKMSVFLNNPNEAKLKAFAKAFNEAPVVAKSDESRCRFDQAKFSELMKDRRRCTPGGEENFNTFNMYVVLAEIAACPKYNIKQIGVIEEYKTRGVTKPCVVSLNGASASIGGGKVQLVTDQDKVLEVPWAAGHDLTGKRNDLVFWRSQFEPAVQDLFSGQAKPGAFSGPEQRAEAPGTR